MTDSAAIFRQAMAPGRFDGMLDAADGSSRSAAPAEGRLMGYSAVEVSDPAAELMDSMEELSFQFEEKAMKSIGERRLGEKRAESSAFVKAVAAWSEIFPDLPSSAFMERLLRELRALAAAGREGGAAELLRRLGEGSSDPAHQFAMLEAMEAALGEGETRLARLMDGARRELLAAEGPAVRAGVNLAQEINRTANSPGEVRGLRDLYRREVLGFDTPQACFRSLLAARGAGRMGEALDFLLRSCGIDLQSAAPSRGAEELRRILGDLQCVQVLRAALDQCGGLAGKMASQFGEQCRLDGEGLCSRLVDLTEAAFVSAGDIAGLIELCALRQLPAQIYFATGFIGILRGLSPRLFAEENGRFRLEEAAQEHLDGLVERQEAEEKRRREKDKRGAA